MSHLNPSHCWAKMSFAGFIVCILLFLFVFPGFSPAQEATNAPDTGISTVAEGPLKAEKPAGEISPDPATSKEKSSEEYGDITEDIATAGEGPTIADPIEPWNRAMYHFNDKFYFWLLKPTAQGYKYVIPEVFRIIFSNFYENIMMPVRFVNNLLQGKPDYAGRELVRFVINSTVGVAGFRDVAKDGFGITGRKADFGQTLGKYGIGSGFYIVWPVLGPSNPRDTVGWVGDLFLKPTTYLGEVGLRDYETIAISAHEKVNYFSFHIGDYETLKGAAVDPYIAIRDAYAQYRKKLIEQNGDSQDQQLKTDKEQ